MQNIDEVKRENLKRVIKKLGKGGQKRLARLINTEPSYLNNIVNERRNLSDDMVARICSVLKINFHEFYINESTPIPVTELERKAVYMAREAEKAHLEQVAEESIEYTIHRIKTVKKQKRKGAWEGAPSRIKVGRT